MVENTRRSLSKKGLIIDLAYIGTKCPAATNVRRSTRARRVCWSECFTGQGQHCVIRVTNTLGAFQWFAVDVLGAGEGVCWMARGDPVFQMSRGRDPWERHAFRAAESEFVGAWRIKVLVRGPTRAVQRCLEARCRPQWLAHPYQVHLRLRSGNIGGKAMSRNASGHVSERSKYLPRSSPRESVESACLIAIFLLERGFRFSEEKPEVRRGSPMLALR